MTEDIKVRILSIYRIVLSVLLAITAVCFIVGACSIYFSTDRNPYTYESISSTFSYIAIPVFVTIFAVVGGAVLHIVLAQEKQSAKGFREKSAMVLTVESRLNFTEIDGKYSLGISREKGMRRILFYTNMALYFVAFVFSAVYSFIPANFTGDYNASVVSLTYILLAAFCLPFALNVARIFIESRSLDRELVLAKAAMVEMKDKGVEYSDVKTTEDSIFFDFLNKKEKQITLYTRIGVTAAALILIFIGVFGGGMADVLAKAIKICTECIGLG